jgi:hypothetical protein
LLRLVLLRVSRAELVEEEELVELEELEDTDEDEDDEELELLEVPGDIPTFKPIALTEVEEELDEEVDGLDEAIEDELDELDELLADLGPNGNPITLATYPSELDVLNELDDGVEEDAELEDTEEVDEDEAEDDVDELDEGELEEKMLAYMATAGDWAISTMDFWATDLQVILEKNSLSPSKTWVSNCSVNNLPETFFAIPRTKARANLPRTSQSCLACLEPTDSRRASQLACSSPDSKRVVNCPLSNASATLHPRSSL